MSEKEKVHPVIQRLAHEEFFHKEVDVRSGRKAIANAEYGEGYISGRAQTYFIHRLSSLPAEADEVTQNFYAEIAFWWAMYDYAQQRITRKPLYVPGLHQKPS